MTYCLVAFLFVCLFNVIYSVLNGEGNDNPLQYSRLKNPMDRGAWCATVLGVVGDWT